VDWQELDALAQRRRFTRRDVQLRARVRAGGGVVGATIENISRGGAFLRVELPVDAEDLVATIDLPQGRGLHVRAKVKWRRTEPAGVGVEFAEFLGDSLP
jgi:hypothetical protein